MYSPPILKDFLLRSGSLSAVKLIGALGRMLLLRILGSEGIGLYQMAYTFYGLLITVVTGGFASALSLATAKNTEAGKQLFHFSLVILVVLGSALGLLTYLFAPQIADLFGDSELVRPIQLCTPAILIVPVLSLMRGFLQGLQHYGYIALSELIEQTVRVFAMVLLAGFLIQKELSEAVGGVIFGAVIGAFCAFLFLLVPLLSSSSKKQFQQTVPPSLSVFFMSSLAIMGTRIILPAAEFIESLLVPNRLVHAGFSVQEATKIYGEFFGMAVSIVFVPTFIIGSLCHIILPRLTIAWDTLDTAGFMNKVKIAFLAALLWGGAASFFLATYSETISVLIVGDGSLAVSIQYLSLASLLASMRDLSTTILWTMDEKKKPLIGLILATIVSSILNFYLIGISGFSIAGVAIGILSFELTSLTFNILSLKPMVRLGKFVRFIFKETFIYAIFLACMHLVATFVHTQLISWNSPFVQQLVMGGTFLVLLPLYLYGHFISRR
ncbi:oligosaccharide flippase family protein [Brevibacillus borstelensis]|uniref:oligosaccharide flippase family protein n=1 Tax=Brevibacillus borstelensis TaxID=45462 RepID=UPI0030BC4467